MAPPPEYDKEPKAPDKSVTNSSNEDSKILYNHIKDQTANTEHKTTTALGNVDIVENNKHVETLDDGQLRALLDEAITYKCPKDREGKSSLFKELLEEVEQDEQACEEAARLGAGRNTRRGRARREHHSSLQDLVAAMAGEAAPRRGRPHPHSHAPAPPAGSVAARALHGGSLPSGVDTSFLLGEEAGGAGGAGGVAGTRGAYLATVRCVNPPPLAERRVSTGDAAPAHELDVITRRSKPMFPVTYTARATLEIGSGSVCSGRAVTTTTASNQVDSGIPFSCITTPEVVASCNTTSSTSQSAVAIDPKPLQLVSSYRAVACLMDGAFPVRPPSPPNALAACTALSASPAQQPRVGAGPAAPRARLCSADEYKKSLDENGNAVQGFGSPLSGSSQHKKPRRKKSSKNETVIKSHQIDGYQGNKDINEVLRFIESNAEGARAPKLRAKHKDDDKKRSAERRKPGRKPARAASLEERSRSSLTELTRRAGPAPKPAKPERRSWGDDTRALLDDAPPELADFQTVTKKRRARRRDRAPGRAPEPPRRAPEPARSSAPASAPASAPGSAPASERSDSNDDTDCAHSPPPAPPAAASYADIARARHNIPDLIESCNFYAEGDEAPPAPVVAQYPALPARKEPPAPDVVLDRRPPVVLLAAGARARDLDGVTFGFDVNEQLLGARCDLLQRAVAVRAGGAALRYVPPPAPPRAARVLAHVVDYVASAWEDVMRSGGKVHYFSECAARNN